MLTIIYFNFETFTQGVYYGRTHSVKTSGHLIPAAAEFSAGVQHCENNLNSRYAHFGMNSDRYSSAVILNGYGVVFVYSDPYQITESGKCLVYTVIHNLIDKVVQTF